MKVKSRNMLRVPGWFNQEKKAVRSKITHKIYRSFAPVLISIKISNTRIIGPKIELPFNQFAIWLMREQIVTGPIWRPSHPSRVRGLKYITPTPFYSIVDCRTLHGCVDWNLNVLISQPSIVMSHPSRVRGLKLSASRNKDGVCRSRTLHGCVDWNTFLDILIQKCVMVAPFTGAWIEILYNGL